MSKKLTVVAAATVTALTSATAAFAGGLEANGYNWDLLFDAAPYATKGTVSYVKIDQPIKNAAGTVIANSSDRVYYNTGFKADFNDASCLISVQNPWGAGVDRNLAYAASKGIVAKERIASNDFGLTCSYGFNAGPGVISIIGGASVQTLSYKADVPYSATDVFDLQLDSTAIGWRLGAAYEVEEIALRVSAIYNSAVDHRLTGTIHGGVFTNAAASANATTPQSIEIKGQTGIAPGWLALASVKWVNWSVLDKLTVTRPGGTIVSTLDYEDGWTITAGVGHQLTQDLTVLASLAWDSGTSKGGDVVTYGNQTDRWSVALGAAYKPSENVELSLGGSYSIMGKGSNTAFSETWDAGNVFALQGGLKVSF